MSEEKQSVVGEPKLPVAATEVAEEEVDIDAIVGDLEDEIEVEEEEETDAPQAATPSPAIDISKLTDEQLQEVAARMSALPTRADQRTKGQKCKLRMYNDKIVVNFKDAYLGLIEDPENNRMLERHLIKILLNGENEYISIPYRTFMHLDQIECDVINRREQVFNDVKGTTYDEHDRLVEMTVTRKEYTFDVKTPDGKELSVEGKVSNG